MPDMLKVLLAGAGDVASGNESLPAMRTALQISQARREQRFQEKQRNRTADYLRSIGREDLADPFSLGIISGSDAMKRVFDDQQAQAEAESFQTVTGPDAEARGLDPTKIYQVDTRTNEVDEIGNAMVDVNIATQPTPGRKKADQAFGEEYVKWTTGGRADTEKMLTQLGEAADALEAGEQNLTGPMIGSVPDAVTAFIAPEAISTRERVEEVVQRSLREILGAQFTEREGERLIARAYNPRLSEEENARRVRAVEKQLRDMMANKDAAAAYFRENGTLTGFEPVAIPNQSEPDDGGWQDMGNGIRMREKP